MLEFGPETFGALNAEDYDALHDPGTTEESVDFLYDLFGNGRILELAIGTGRVAVPLAKRGMDIHGIEGSPEMVAKMREKDGGADIPVVIGDMADCEIDGPFDGAFLIFNTLFNLTSQAAQIRCFQNTAAKLQPGGRFLIETIVPDLSGFINGQRVRAMKVGFNSTWLEAALHDPVEQTFTFQRIRITADGVRLVPLPMRYAWPSEIDLMARLAGLELEQRWGGWDRSAFGAESKMHVSVYRKLGE